MRGLGARTLGRLAAGLLCGTALPLLATTALAATFNVGGGTISTTQADNSTDNTGTGGGFALQANTATAGDAISVTGVVINNTSHVPNGRALDVGGSLSSAGSYSITMHGSTLAGDTGFATGGAGAWFQSVGGLVSFDSMGGATNTISGKQGLAVINNTSNGSVRIKTGADTITSSDGEALYGVAQGTGTIAIDTAGVTLTSNGLYGIVASGGNGAITIGGLGNGLTGIITANSGSGIFTTSTGDQAITLGSGGTITALNGMTLQGNAVTVSSFGTINGTNNAINASLVGALTLSLQASSVTSGALLGGSGNDNFTIFTGADVTNATFNGTGGLDTLSLRGIGNASLELDQLSGIENLQKDDAGTWSINRNTTLVTVTVNAGSLRVGNVFDSLSSTKFIMAGGTLEVIPSGIGLRVGSMEGNGTVNLNSNALTVGELNTSTILAATVTASQLNKIGTGTLTLTGSNTYANGVAVNAGTVVLGSTGTLTTSTLSVRTGGTFISEASTSIGNLSFDDGKIAAVSGQTLSFTNSVIFGGTGPLIFGSASQTGTITIAALGCCIPFNSTVQVAGGTLRDLTLPPSTPDGFGAVSFAAYMAPQFTVDAGAIVDLNDHSVRFAMQPTKGMNLRGAGQIVTGTSAATVIQLRSTDFSGGISGAGGVTFLSNVTSHILTGSNSYTGGTTINSGATLQIGNGGSTGGITGNVTNNSALIFDRSNSLDFAGVISGSGTVTKRGTGTLTLSGNSTYSGGSIISAGVLQIGNGGSTGSVTGSSIVNSGALIFNRSDAFAFAGVISGAGTVAKMGVGTTTLSGANTYSGVTTVSGGTLSVTGTLSNSNTSVASGGALTGTGSVRNVTVTSGGTVGPLGTGTLTVQGNLTLNAGAAYADSITPSAAGLSNVSGSAGLNGTAVVSAGAGAYSAGQRYTLLNASGGIAGTFVSLTTPNLPGNVRGELAYDATHVYLDLKANAITPLLPAGASPNLGSLAAGIDAGLQRGTVLNSGFTALFNLQGAALGSALNQIAGQGAPNIATTGGQSLTPFLSVMQGQGAFGGSGTSTAANFAPGNVYGAADAPRRAQLAPGATRVWGSVYGGHAGISANAASGAAGLSASNVGFIAGAEVSLTDGLRLGSSAGFGRQDFSSANSVGDSDDVMLGLYARQDILENGYLAAAFAYSWHDIATTRTITVAGTDVLGARFDAHAIGGRIEGGWRLALDEALGVTPFFAFAGDNFYAPAYAESVISGSSSFALSYAANKTAQKRTEFGTHFDHAFDLGGGDMLSADARAAWAHQLDDAPFVTATFQGLPGSTFRLLGVRGATDTALLGLGLKIQNPDGLDLGLRMDSQVGAGTTVLQGMGTVSWRW